MLLDIMNPWMAYPAPNIQDFRKEKMINNYMTKNELAKLLNISLATVNRKLKEIPHIKMGNHRVSRVLFDPEKVKEYLKKFEVNT